MAQKKTIAELLIKIGVSVEGAAKVERRIEGLKDKSQQAAKRFGRLRLQAQKLTPAFKTIAKGTALFGAALAGAAVGAGKFTISQLESIDATNKLAESVGVGVEEFQRLEFAAGQSGVGSRKLSMALKGLNARLLQVKQTGTGDAKIALDDLGLSLDQLEGKTATEKFAVISDALKGVSDDATRSALSARLFGEQAGPALANLLAQGGDGIRELASQAQVLTEDQADAATEFVDRFGEMKNEVGFLAKTIALDLLPPLRDLVVGVREWISENRDLIKSRIGDFVERLAYSFGRVVDTAQALWVIVSELTTAFAEMLTPAGESPDDFFRQLGRTMTDLLSPAQLLASAFEMVAEGLASIGLESETLTRIASRLRGIADGGGRAPRGKTAEEILREQEAEDVSAVGAAIAAMGGVYAPMIRARRKVKTPRRSGSARGTGAKTKAEPKSNVTFADVLRNVLRGRGENVAENVRGLAARTPTTKAITPTVAVDFTYITVNQEISNPDPMAAGSAAAEGVRRVWQKAITTTGQQMPALPSR